MLVTAGISDPRVTYWEPAKYVARLRATKTDDNPLLLKTNMASGHFGQSGRYDALLRAGRAVRVRAGPFRQGRDGERGASAHPCSQLSSSESVSTETAVETRIVLVLSAVAAL